MYAPLAPLVPLLASFAFFASSMIYKYQLLFVSITGRLQIAQLHDINVPTEFTRPLSTGYESGGRMWRVAINRILICLVFQQGKSFLVPVSQCYGH